MTSASKASIVSGSTALSSTEIHHLPYENKYVVQPSIRGLAKRMIHRLRKYQTIDGFSVAEVYVILDSMCDLLRQAPAFIHMSAPVVIFGDTHGQFADLLRFIDKVGEPPKTPYLFLGDYCDRGRKSIEILMLLFCYKLLYPPYVQILRGNHECAKMNRLYGFYEECRRSYGTQLWKKFQMVFNEMPLCCMVDERIICMHGGISPDIKGMESLYKLKKPRTHAECDTGIALDLMWSDPAAGTDACCSWQFNKLRNASWMFGTESVKEFNRQLNIDMIVRAHEVCRNGYMFYCDKLLCTVFSAPNYCGTDGNAASVMIVSSDLRYSFLTFKPKLDRNQLSKEKMAELEKQSKNADVKSPNPTSTLHRTALPDKSHENPPAASTTKPFSPPQNAIKATTPIQTTPAAMESTQIVTATASSASSSSNESVISTTHPPPPPSTTSSLTSNAPTQPSTETSSSGSSTTSGSATAATASSVNNSVTGITTTETSKTTSASKNPL